MKSIYQILVVLFTFSLSTHAFDHSYKKFAKVLKENVVLKSAQSRVTYQDLKKKPEVLNAILNSWQKVKKEDFNKWSKDQQLAFLINAYNGFTLKLIIDNYPVKSIKDIGSFFSSPWKKEFFELFGKKAHLDHIEHELIRKKFKEPRIHFAVNCASLGCPSLALVPYQAQKLDDQLESAAKAFIQNADRNRFDQKEKKAYLSNIFKWYGDDFERMTGKDYKSFIKKFIPAYSPNDWEIEWLSYDWNLNEVKK